MLSDPKGAIPPYDALILIAPRRIHDARLHAALQPLIGRIGIVAMRRANLAVDRDQNKRSPEHAARDLESAIVAGSSSSRGR